MTARCELLLTYPVLCSGVNGSPFTHAAPDGQMVDRFNEARTYCGRRAEVERVYRASVAVAEPLAATSSDEHVRLGADDGPDPGVVLGQSPCCLSCSRAIDRIAAAKSATPTTQES